MAPGDRSTGGSVAEPDLRELRRLVPAFDPARTRTRVRVLCFPYAGAGVSAFRGWQEAMPPEVEALPVQLPGRESRWHEPAIINLSALGRVLTTVLRPMLDAPYAVFGHSMGGLIAFEFVRHLRRAQIAAPVHLFVSSARAPHVPDRELPLHLLPDEAFLAQLVARSGAIPAQALHNLELARALLPTLRADFGMCETYYPLPEEPLDIPITVYGGRHDRMVVPSDLVGWNMYTRRGFKLQLLAGDHFFVNQQCGAFLSTFAADLAVIASAEP